MHEINKTLPIDKLIDMKTTLTVINRMVEDGYLRVSAPGKFVIGERV
jgi:hypothetical protein